MVGMGVRAAHHSLRACHLLRIEDSVKDRKSTRLNSSHANISYAVFCLKKKKKQDKTTSLLANIVIHTRRVHPTLTISSSVGGYVAISLTSTYTSTCLRCFV